MILGGKGKGGQVYSNNLTSIQLMRYSYSRTRKASVVTKAYIMGPSSPIFPDFQIEKPFPGKNLRSKKPASAKYDGAYL